MFTVLKLCSSVQTKAELVFFDLTFLQEINSNLNVDLMSLVLQNLDFSLTFLFFQPSAWRRAD